MPSLIRIIVIAAIIWLVYRLVKQWRSQAHQRDKSVNKKSTSQVENIVACEVCGIHIPENEAISHAGKQFCSTAHLERYQEDHD